ncbi:MAG: hypothetical protein RLZZ136_539 [Pseudomonadota bacterium]|jgi:phasin family protein
MTDETPIETQAAAEKAYASAAEAVILSAPAVQPTKARRAAPKKQGTAKRAVAKPTALKTLSTKAKPAKKPAASASTKSKDTLMATAKTKTTAFAGTIKETFADVQAKAKTIYEKGAAAAAGAGEFTKGNAEALVESGKILSAGIKTLGTDYVTEGKKAYETLTADAKELAAMKSPTDFFQLQSELLRRNFDSAVALSSKNTEAALKLVNDAFAPISSRVTVAVAAVKSAA